MLYTVNSNGEIIATSVEQVIQDNIGLATQLVNKHKEDSIRQKIKGLEADLAGTIEINRQAEDSIRSAIKKLQEQLEPTNTDRIY